MVSTTASAPLLHGRSVKCWLQGPLPLAGSRGRAPGLPYLTIPAASAGGANPGTKGTANTVDTARAATRRQRDLIKRMADVPEFGVYVVASANPRKEWARGGEG